MKRRTILLITLATGFIFALLLFFQVHYLAEALRLRRDTFESSVQRVLYRVSESLEHPETVSPSVQTETEDESLPAGLVRGVNLDGITNHDTAQTAASEDTPLAERITSQAVDGAIRRALTEEGIEQKYHFRVLTLDGREVSRCEDYPEKLKKGRHEYSVVLFPHSVSAARGELRILFPELDAYLFSAVRFSLPAVILTLLLLGIFIFTIWGVFRARRLDRMKNEFIGNMTHELKTPVASISLASQMLGDSSIEKSPAMYAHLSKVLTDESRRLRYLTEKVLETSLYAPGAGGSGSGAGGKKTLRAWKFTEFSLSHMAAEVEETFGIRVENLGGSIRLERNGQANPDEEDDMLVYADEFHVRNVLFNLLDNAVKYRDPERPLHITVRLSTTEKQKEHFKFFGHKNSQPMRYARLEVSDTGLGIKRDELKHIFEKFYRVSTGNRHDVKGFGLGLAYVSSVIRAMGGTIRAESEVGVGTRFIIHLPLVEEA